MNEERNKFAHILLLLYLGVISLASWFVLDKAAMFTIRFQRYDQIGAGFVYSYSGLGWIAEYVEGFIPVGVVSVIKQTEMN